MNEIIPFFYMLALLMLLIGGIYTLKTSKKPLSFNFLYKDLKRKIIMTLSLGIVFLCLYFLFIQIGVALVNNLGSDLIFLALKYPIEAIYGGLFLFSFLSLTIYLVRMFIKYFYLTRGKDL